jgi:23S rRNA (adenine1618-N6)-methyltransferase
VARTANLTLPLKPSPIVPAPHKVGLHPRNPHKVRYDFQALARTFPALARYIRPSPIGSATIDFADPAAVLALNRALLAHHYGIAQWEIPAGYLCPPIPGRADYIHHLADLLGEGRPSGTPRGRTVRVLDIGVGANCIYPIIGVSEYGWRFVGTDVDPAALASADSIVGANPILKGQVEVRWQRSRRAIFDGVIAPDETFAASICNPPFHASPHEAAAGTERKLRQLRLAGPGRPVRNFGGRGHELWCEGGEVGFGERLIAESAKRPRLCGWFTSLISKRESLPALHRALARVQPREVRTIKLAHGQKKTRLLAWRFFVAEGEGIAARRGRHQNLTTRP